MQKSSVYSSQAAGDGNPFIQKESTLASHCTMYWWVIILSLSLPLSKISMAIYFQTSQLIFKKILIFTEFPPKLSNPWDIAPASGLLPIGIHFRFTTCKNLGIALEHLPGAINIPLTNSNGVFIPASQGQQQISLQEHIQNQLSLVGFSRKQTEKLRFLSRGEWRTLAGNSTCEWWG